MKTERIQSIDYLRGLAIISVLVYHFCFDLNYFGFVKLDFNLWWVLIFEFVTQTVFLGLVGISVFLVWQKKQYEDFVRFQAKRFWILIFFSVLISCLTAYVFEEEFVRFGVLHLIAFSIFILTLLVRSKLAQWISLLIFLLGSFYLWQYPVFLDGEWFVALGIHPLRFASVDYFPIFPWFLIPLIAFMTAKYWVSLFQAIDNRIKFGAKLSNGVIYLGRRTLWVYLIHQPILFGFLWFVKNVY